MKNEPTSLLYVAWLTPLAEVAEVKASLNRANMSRIQDPKPGELAMTRVKAVEIQLEARTHSPCNTRG